VSITPVAVAVALALLVTVIVNDAAPPRATEGVEVVLVIESDAEQPVTVTVAGALLVFPVPALVELKLALFGYDWQLFAAVDTVAVKLIVTDAPGARLQVPHVRLVAPALGLLVAAGVADPETKWNPVGSVSLTVTPVAVSVALAALVTVIV
jgi:hypothetical protein